MAGLALPAVGRALWGARCVPGGQEDSVAAFPAQHMASMRRSSLFGTGLFGFASKYNALTYITLFTKRGKVSESLWVLWLGFACRVREQGLLLWVPVG